MTGPGCAEGVVYLAGNRWDDVAGTDHQLAKALGRITPVLWVDPPFSVLDRLVPGRPVPRTSQVAEGVRCLQLVGPPGASRPGLRRLARAAVAAGIRRHLRSAGFRPEAYVVASAQAAFPARDGATRMLFVTDDWVTGAPMMGLSSAEIARRLTANLGAADLVAAVSPDLAALLQGPDVSAQVLANGVTPVGLGEARHPREAVAGLLGQLNERIDVDLLHAVVDAGVPLRVIGPLTAKDPDAVVRITSLLARPEVEWVGRVAPEQLAGELARVRVGLTPYTDSAFNRASFPLKTLEYLGAGLPVVATDLPSARWLECADVQVTGSCADFVIATLRAVQAGFDAEDADRRLAFAGRHNWGARARRMLQLIRTAEPRSSMPGPADAQPAATVSFASTAAVRTNRR